ncbi:MAG: histidine kinase [Bacteroidota bacterium]
MKKKFYIYALISSLILAFYGSIPLYFHRILELAQVVELYFFGLLGSLLFWIINGYLFIFLRRKRSWDTILVSYVLTLSLNLIRIPLLPFFDFSEYAPFNSRASSMYVLPIFGTVAVNTIILLIINFIIEEREIKEAQNTIAELTIKKLEAENLVLMQQLQPHFLFNALSILKSLIKEDSELAEEYSIKLSDFLRYGIESHNAELVSIEQEMQFVNNYIDLQKIRFDNAFEFHTNIPEAIRDAKVPVFAIQILVENAFKHNYFTEKRPLEIGISHEEEFLHVWNNIVSVKLTERTGTGLPNLAKRFEFLTGKEMMIQHSETHFRVKIPIITQ